MTEVDIDKILEKKEKQEELQKKMKVIRRTGIISGIAVLAALIAVIIVIILTGESSVAYFPLENTGKYIYNRKNKSPEVWQFQDKKARVGDYDCVVLNKIDQADYFSIQEYYVAGKKGIIKLAGSKDFGRIKQDKMRLLPERLKVGLEFNAGTVKNTGITGKIAGTEELSTPVGECKGYLVEYRAGSYMNLNVWYGKGVGIINYTNKVTGEKLDLVGRVEK